MTLNENKEVAEMQEAVAVAEEMQEAVQQKEFSKHVAIYGDLGQYSWETASIGGIVSVSFCTFNTTIGEEEFRTNVGITAEGVPAAVISYETEITSDTINFIINHIIQATVDTTKENDEIFFNREEDNVNIEDYNTITPVITMVGVLHSWANIARFEANNGVVSEDETVKQQTEEEAAQ